MQINVTLSQSPKKKPESEENLGFGRVFTDHMFLMDFCDGEWKNPRIVPYSPLPLDPAAMVLHYGQELFEGLKAYRGRGDEVFLFRHIENVRRMNRSCERLFVPVIPEDAALSAIEELVKVDRDWIPRSDDASLYIRPFVIATDPFLGIAASKTYLFVVILSPVGAYYKGGMTPTDIYVETEDVRACKGGMGEAKVGANYAATIRAQERAKIKGFSQVLWLDAHSHRKIEEIGTSNAFFKIGGKVVTPALSGSILPGITRMSVIDLLKHWGVPVEEREVTVDEIVSAAKSGVLEEVFATGTAAVISPVGSLFVDGESVKTGGGIGALSRKLYDTLTAIQRGRADDVFGWRHTINN